MIKSDDDKTIPKDTWPKAVQLRNGTLMQQMDLICVVCHKAIRIIEKTLVTQHAWPELHKGAHYKQEVLLEAVKVLHANNTYQRWWQEARHQVQGIERSTVKWWKVCQIYWQMGV